MLNLQPDKVRVAMVPVLLQHLAGCNLRGVPDTDWMQSTCSISFYGGRPAAGSFSLTSQST